MATWIATYALRKTTFLIWQAWLMHQRTIKSTVVLKRSSQVLTATIVFVFECVFLTVFEATNCTTLSFLIWHSHPMHHQTIKSIIFVSGVMFKLRCPDVSA